jgi:hypothetical protein
VSVYDIEPVDFAGLNTIPIAERGGKVRLEHFARPYRKADGLASWLDSLPRLLASDDLRAAIDAIAAARDLGKPVIWAMGGHVIKCGLAPILIDLMERGYATAFASNGSASIHDFEIAIAGATSEDVEAVLPDGRFGTAEETGREMNTAIAAGDRAGLGIGEALGVRLETLAAVNAKASLLAAAYRHRTPFTVHVAFGTDTPHTHPAADPAAIGRSTDRDFRLFARLVSLLDGGGVYLNVGSAVVMPEVFLKALSVVRNLGCRVENFTTVNLDFLQHYRPRVNVVNRPHAGAGGRGIALTGHHEIMVPLIAAALIERSS